MLQERGRSHTQPQQNQWTWERFCREEAREAASAFLERVRRFKSRHATARDVHDSTFTNEFSAAFLEESSVLMASAGETILPTTTSGTPSLAADVQNNNVVGGSEPDRRLTTKQNNSNSRKSWWNGLFKWSKSKRSGESQGSPTSGSSTSSNSGQSQKHRAAGSTKVKKKRGIKVVKETASVQLLNLSECEDKDEMNWSPCRLTLVEQQDNYQIEIYSPPRVSGVCHSISFWGLNFF